VPRRDAIGTIAVRGRSRGAGDVQHGAEIMPADEHLVRAARGRAAREVAKHLEDESGLAGTGRPDDLKPLGL